jgi:hypothetical protein
MPRATHDLLDRVTGLLKRQDLPRGVFASEKALVLEPLRGSQQCRVDRDGAEGTADSAHRQAHGVQERGAGVLHQVPSIGDLNGIGQRSGDSLAIAATAITRHDADPGMLAQPCFCGCLFPVGQQRHDTSAFQVADDCPVAMITAEALRWHSNGFAAGTFASFAQSSMPITASFSVRGMARRLTTRRSVSLLTGSMSRWANPAPGLPPNARPRW